RGRGGRRDRGQPVDGLQPVPARRIRERFRARADQRPEPPVDQHRLAVGDVEQRRHGLGGRRPGGGDDGLRAAPGDRGDLELSFQVKDQAVRRLAAPDITQRKGKTPIVCLTAYTAPMASILDQHCELLLVGDSVGMVLHGLPNTVGVTLEMMILHGQAVMRGSRRAMVVVDMPFGSYEGAPEAAYANAARVMKETGAGAVKVEAGATVAPTIEYLVQRGVPVMGHVGLRPQAVLVDGRFKAKGRDAEERRRIIEDAK